MDQQTILRMSPSDVRANFRPDHHFFERATMRFFGDTMKSFRMITHNGKRFMYRRPSATVNVFGKTRRVGREFFGAWEIVPHGDYVGIRTADDETKAAIFECVAE